MARSLAAYTGHWALVTGAGDGIGEMLARRLAASGLQVIVQDIRAEAAERVAREIGPTARPLAFDVSDRSACLEAAGGLAAAGVSLNLLWINAGVGVGASLIEGSQKTIEWAYGVNVLGAIWTAQAFMPLLRSAAGARLLAVTASSAALRAPEAPFSLYAATKHATLGVAEGLAAEAEASGIKTLILCPGLLNTSIWDGARARPERFGGARRADPAISGPWDAAAPPEVMWPHIAAAIDAGGGYLVCSTEAENIRRFAHRQAAILSGWHDLKVGTA